MLLLEKSECALYSSLHIKHQASLDSCDIPARAALHKTCSSDRKLMVDDTIQTMVGLTSADVSGNTETENNLKIFVST